MKRRDEIVVGATIFGVLVIVVAGALWLSHAQFGGASQTSSARFRTVGGLGVGDPVVLRGVRVGRVKEIRLGQKNWVEAELQIYQDATLPVRPAIIAASGSLFGEWQASIVAFDQPFDDPALRRELDEAAAVGGQMWPGATLPDIGQLTAQAGRIAGDIASVSSRIQTAFDSSAVAEVQKSVKDFGRVADQLARFTQQQSSILGNVGTNLQQGSDVLAEAARSLSNSLARIDSATNEGELVTILSNAQAAAVNAREATQSLRDVMAVAHRNQESIQRIIQGADTMMTRIMDRRSTAGLLLGDTTLYVEATKAVMQFERLLADIQANPRKYFSFKVF
ncbi:MAG: MCE family protein [Gemmatimonadetes bacterium]|nr:MCE family protein [Gemmatimonadota bacterium]